jgi:hypothetical protein
MQIVLTDSDLAAMPAALRQELLARLLPGGTAEAAQVVARDEQGRAVLDEAQAFALVRHVSFGRRHRPLHDLLRVLAKEGAAAAPLRQLGIVEERQLQRRLQILDRLAQLLTRDRKVRLVAAVVGHGFSVHPQTRLVLRDVFDRLDRSGTQEEALWE